MTSQNRGTPAWPAMEPNPREGEMKGKTGSQVKRGRKQKEKIENPYTGPDPTARKMTPEINFQRVAMPKALQSQFPSPDKVPCFDMSLALLRPCSWVGPCVSYNCQAPSSSSTTPLLFHAIHSPRRFVNPTGEEAWTLLTRDLT